MRKEYGFLCMEIVRFSDGEYDVVRTSNTTGSMGSVATYIQEGDDDCGFDFWDEA